MSNLFSKLVQNNNEYKAHDDCNFTFSGVTSAISKNESNPTVMPYDTFIWYQVSASSPVRAKLFIKTATGSWQTFYNPGPIPTGTAGLIPIFVKKGMTFYAEGSGYSYLKGDYS